MKADRRRAGMKALDHVKVLVAADQVGRLFEKALHKAYEAGYALGLEEGEARARAAWAADVERTFGPAAAPKPDAIR